MVTFFTLVIDQSCYNKYLVCYELITKITEISVKLKY